MIIPPFRWGDIVSRDGENVIVLLTEAQQYTLMLLLSYLQLNPSVTLTDFSDYPIDDITTGIDATMNALLDNEMVSDYLESRILLPAVFAIKISGNAIIYNKAVNNGGIAFQNTSASTDILGGSD